MLMIRVHESTKTIGEKEHYQGMNDRGAIRTTIGDPNEPRDQ